MQYHIAKSHQILVKSVNGGESYSKFSEVTQKDEVSIIVNCRHVIVKIRIKVCVQNILHVLECKLKDVNTTA